MNWRIVFTAYQENCVWSGFSWGRCFTGVISLFFLDILVGRQGWAGEALWGGWRCGLQRRSQHGGTWWWPPSHSDTQPYSNLRLSSSYIDLFYLWSFPCSCSPPHLVIISGLSARVMDLSTILFQRKTIFFFFEPYWAMGSRRLPPCVPCSISMISS